jgi:hypothetical protein
MAEQAESGKRVQSDIIGFLIGSMQFSLRAAPYVIMVATLFRSILLLTGSKRAFKTWTRNTVLSLLSIVLAPGIFINTGIRYAVCTMLRVHLDGIGAGATYAEVNVFIRIDRPPRVAPLLIALFLSSLASIFVGFVFLFVPLGLLMEFPLALVCWYLAVAVLLNSCIRSGDLSLIGASLKKQGHRGAIEFVAVIAALALFYTQIVGVYV